MVAGLATLIDRVAAKDEVAVAVDGALFRYHPTFRELLEEKIPVFMKTTKKVCEKHARFCVDLVRLH